MSVTTAENDIITAMQTPLKSLTTIQPTNVGYVNVPFRPTHDACIKVFFLPTQMYQASLGTFGQYRYDGIFQIDVHVPTGGGRADMNAILAELRGIYKPGTTLTNGEISVQCKAVWESTSDESNNWFVVPLNIRYYAYTDNE